MNKIFLGTEYGGWVVDLDLINENDTIICAGVGEDISFETELLKHKKIKIVEIDPTEKSHRFLESKSIENMILIKKALESKDKNFIKIFKNKFTNYVSESSNPTHTYTSDEYYEVETISPSELINTYQPSFIKMDVEGSEYNVLLECLGVKQICVEFHHHCLNDKKLDDTLNLVNKFLDYGYEIIDNRQNYQELTFVLKK